MIRIILAALLCVTSLPAFAQDIGASTQMLAEINRIAPLQNPEYRRTKEILGRKMLDGSHRVVGEVQDVIFARNGSIISLLVNFDRLRLGTPAYLNYNTLDIKPAGNGYAIAINNEEIEKVYPQILAQTETAAGTEDDIALSKAIGTDVMAADGRAVGRIDDILFGSNGERAEAIYVKMTTGVLMGKAVAVPIKSVTFGNNTGKPTALVSNDMANAMIAYVSKK
jgi:sporulation protein YlmC with PRC-barrel domain